MTLPVALQRSYYSIEVRNFPRHFKPLGQRVDQKHILAVGNAPHLAIKIMGVGRNFRVAPVRSCASRHINTGQAGDWSSLGNADCAAAIVRDHQLVRRLIHMSDRPAIARKEEQSSFTQGEEQPAVRQKREIGDRVLANIGSSDFDQGCERQVFGVGLQIPYRRHISTQRGVGRVIEQAAKLFRCYFHPALLNIADERARGRSGQCLGFRDSRFATQVLGKCPSRSR